MGIDEGTPSQTSSWSIAADGPLITRRESLVVRFAYYSFVDPFNHKNENCGAFITKLRAGASPCACYRVHVHLAGEPEPATARGKLTRPGRLAKKGCCRGLVRRAPGCTRT